MAAQTAEQQLNAQYDEALRRLKELTLQQAQQTNGLGAQLTAQQQALGGPLLAASAQAGQDVQGAYGSTSGAYTAALKRLQDQLALYGGAEGNVQAQAQQDLGAFGAQRQNQSTYQQALQRLAAQQFEADKEAGGQLAADSAAYLGSNYQQSVNDMNVQHLDALKSLRDQMAAAAASGGGGYGGGGGGRSYSRGGGGSGRRSSRTGPTYTSYADADASINGAAEGADLLQKYRTTPQYQLIPYTPRTNTRIGQSASLGHQVR